MSKLIITVALNGSVPTKKMNPHTPITPDEIAEAAVRCREAGRASLTSMRAIWRAGRRWTLISSRKSIGWSARKRI